MAHQTTIVNQPSGGANFDGARIVTQLVRKGDYAAMLAEARSKEKGSLIEGAGFLLTWSIRRETADIGVVTYSCVDQTSESWQSNEPLSEVVSVRSARVELPVERYCDTMGLETADVWGIARWRKEPDNELYKKFQFMVPQGVVPLEDRTKQVAAKIAAGKERVLRFYPVVVRTRVHARIPSGAPENLSHIETPPEFASAADAWLKVQDDVTGNADGTFTRTEMWQGAEEWDANFYGTGAERWAFGKGDVPPDDEDVGEPTPDPPTTGNP